MRIFGDNWQAAVASAWAGQWTKSGTQVTSQQRTGGRIVTGTTANASTGMRATLPINGGEYLKGRVRFTFPNVTSGGFYYFIHFGGAGALTSSPLALPNSYELRFYYYNVGTDIGIEFYEIDGAGAKTYRNGMDKVVMVAGDSAWVEWEWGGAPTTDRLKLRVYKHGTNPDLVEWTDWSSSIVANNQGKDIALIIQNGDTTTENLEWNTLSISDTRDPTVATRNSRYYR